MCTFFFSTRTISVTSIKDKAQHYIDLKVQVVIVLVFAQSIHITEGHDLAFFPFCWCACCKCRIRICKK